MAINSIKSDKDLKHIIDGCVSNDRKSQEVLYRHYFSTMEHTVRRYTTDNDQVVDILNNGFLKAFKNISQYSWKGSFEGWLRKIVFHCVSDYMRGKSNDVKYLIFDTEIKDKTAIAEDNLYFDDLMNLISTLPENNMKVFQLYAVEGFRHAEIAKILDMNENTCRWHLSEARKLLKKKLKDQNKRYEDVG